jgi:protein-disulfide isomerase
MNFSTARTWLDLTLTVLMLAVTVVVLKAHLSVPPTPGPRPTPIPPDPVAIAGFEIEGQSNAPLGIITYSDFQCPFCGKFAREVLPELRSAYLETGRAFIAFSHFPLESIHSDALLAAATGVCIGSTAGFWQFHDKIFAEPKIDITTAGLQLLLKEVGDVNHEADFETIAKCATTSGTEIVRRQLEVARQYGVASTPTFFLGRRLSSGELQVEAHLRGARPFREFDEALKKIETQ